MHGYTKKGDEIGTIKDIHKDNRIIITNSGRVDHILAFFLRNSMSIGTFSYFYDKFGSI